MAEDHTTRHVTAPSALAAALATLTAVLERQREVLDARLTDIHEQRGMEVARLRLQRWSERMKVAVQGLAIFAGGAVVLGASVAVWQASRANALVIEPLSVPPALADQGLTGTVLATRLLDRLATLQAATDSARAPDTYKDNWRDDIKVKIPDTGVSIGELLRVLRAWLGRETHISGEVFRSGGGLAVATRAGAHPATTFTGADDELDALLTRNAEALYARTQPYRYSRYLFQAGRAPEALQILHSLAERGPESERPWAYIGWGLTLPDHREGAQRIRQGLALNPGLAAGWTALAATESDLGHDGAAADAWSSAAAVLRGRRMGGLVARAADQSRLAARAAVAEARADYAAGAALHARAASLPDYQGRSLRARAEEAVSLALAHDLSPLNEPDRWTFAAADPFGPPLRARAVTARASMTDDWTGVADALAALEADARARPDDAFDPAGWRAQVHPWRAVALARTGQVRAAEALLLTLPADCYPCLRARGLVGAERDAHAEAERAFAEAIVLAPRLPFAFLERGRARLQAHHLDGALADARQAGRLAPTWADAAVLEGEALAAAGECAPARRAFARAAALAPAWRRPPISTPACDGL